VTLARPRAAPPLLRAARCRPFEPAPQPAGDGAGRRERRSPRRDHRRGLLRALGPRSGSRRHGSMTSWCSTCRRRAVGTWRREHLPGCQCDVPSASVLLLVSRPIRIGPVPSRTSARSGPTWRPVRALRVEPAPAPRGRGARVRLAGTARTLAARDQRPARSGASVVIGAMGHCRNRRCRASRASSASRGRCFTPPPGATTSKLAARASR